MKDATVAVQAIRDVVNYAGARGVEVAALVRDAGIDRRKLEDNNGRLAGASLGRLWELAAGRADDPFFGMRLGSLATAGVLGILGYTMLSSRNLGAALDRLVRHGQLYTFGIDFDVLRSGGVLRIECRIVRHVDNYLLASPRHPLECTMAAIRSVASSLVGRPVPVRSVALGHSDPGYGLETYRALLGAWPEFDAAVYAIELDGRAADWAIATANNQLLESLDATADQLLAELRSGRSVTDGVTRSITGLLKGEVPRVDDVAKSLAMSSRSLQ